MLIETDRCRTPGSTPGVDLWWSGKHDNHGGNVQVVTVPDGWPIWASPHLTSQLAWIAYHSGDVVTRDDGLLKKLLAGSPGRCDDREFHGSLHVASECLVWGAPLPHRRS